MLYIFKTLHNRSYVSTSHRGVGQLPVSGGRQRRQCAARDSRDVRRVEAQAERQVCEDRVSLLLLEPKNILKL